MARTNDMLLARVNADTERPEIWAVRSGDTVIPIAGGDGAAERERREGEAARQKAEAARVAAETARAKAEDARAAAETARAAAQKKNDADQQLNNEAVRKLSPVVLATGQYDPGTLEPTVVGEPNRMYFVPITAASMEAVSPLADGVAEAVAAGNAYVEWMWLNGAWEQMGTSRLEARPISTDEVDEVASGKAPSGASVLSLTGLSYLWGKLRAAFASLSHKHSAADLTAGVLVADRLPTVPVSKGGTGSTSAPAALTALGAASATDVAALRDSVSQATYDFPDADHDLLRISIDQPSHPANRTSKIVVSGPAALSGRPGAWVSGPVIAVRRVWILGGHAIVELTEGFPARRRWLNFYNGGNRAWSGWEQA